MLQAVPEFFLSTGYCRLVGSTLAQYWLVVGGIAGSAPERRLRRYDL